MGKNKIDLTARIENDTKRGKTFFKRKRHFLRKGMELSNLCEQKILAFIYDEEKERLVYYASDLSFNLEQANAIVKKCIFDQKYHSLLEVYSNEDYATLNTLDYRTMRKKKRYTDQQIAYIRPIGKAQGDSLLGLQAFNSSLANPAVGNEDVEVPPREETRLDDSQYEARLKQTLDNIRQQSRGAPPEAPLPLRSLSTSQAALQRDEKDSFTKVRPATIQQLQRKPSDEASKESVHSFEQLELEMQKQIEDQAKVLEQQQALKRQRPSLGGLSPPEQGDIRLLKQQYDLLQKSQHRLGERQPSPLLGKRPHPRSPLATEAILAESALSQAPANPAKVALMERLAKQQAYRGGLSSLLGGQPQGGAGQLKSMVKADLPIALGIPQGGHLNPMPFGQNSADPYRTRSPALAQPAEFLGASSTSAIGARHLAAELSKRQLMGSRQPFSMPRREDIEALLAVERSLRGRKE